MTLVDTSVWVDHFRYGNEALAGLLDDGLVAIHPFVIGEIACGRFPDRSSVLGLLSELPNVPVATEAEALAFIESRALMGRGVGYVDVHLLVSVALDPDCSLWTLDGRLGRIAAGIGLGAPGSR